MIIFSTGIYTEDFETPYEIKSGDINSSELINYQNQNLKDRLKTWSSIDLVGKWSCNLYTDDNSIWTSYAATFGSFEGIYKTSVPHVYTFKNDGDGTFSVEQNPVHTFSGGIFDISLTVTDENGFSNTKTKSDYIFVVSTEVQNLDIGGNDAIVFKMESHNHPSFIEPYQGAATGDRKSTRLNSSHT
mgnify:CR=1 FL=1